MASERILDLLRRPVDVGEFHEIRELWKTHSIAEDDRDLPGFISTLTEDCAYEVAGRELAGMDMKAPHASTPSSDGVPRHPLRPEYIVVGPQGVCEEARVTATHEARWLDHEPSGARLEWRERDLLPVGSASAEVQGRETVYTDLSFPVT